jgi:trans-2,3-dihydro-3-hydroxyanthranilate isomerase
VRVFTRGDEGGNHLGVVNDVVGVSDESMQSIASELGFSETVFVDWVDPTKDPAVRIFTPEMELPFAGHPLVGSAWVLSMLGPGATGRIRTQAGAVTYNVDGDTVHVTADIPMNVIEPDETPSAISAAGLPVPVSTRTIALPKHYLIAEYDDHDTVLGLDPDMDALRSHFGLLAFAQSGSDVTSRFFVPSAGVPEDPATGSAAVALAKEFKHRGVPNGEVVIRQGDVIGHPSTIRLAWGDFGATIGGTVRRDEVVQVP